MRERRVNKLTHWTRVTLPGWRQFWCLEAAGPPPGAALQHGVLERGG